MAMGVVYPKPSPSLHGEHKQQASQLQSQALNARDLDVQTGLSPRVGQRDILVPRLAFSVGFPITQTAAIQGQGQTPLLNPTAQ